MAEKKTSDTKPKAKKKAVKKSPAKKAATKTATTGTKTKSTTKTKTATGTVTTRKKSTRAKEKTGNGKERLAMIEQTAYFIAEKRGFVGGDPEQDWLLAEKQVDQMLREKQTG